MRKLRITATEFSKKTYEKNTLSSVFGSLNILNLLSIFFIGLNIK